MLNIVPTDCRRPSKLRRVLVVGAGQRTIDVLLPAIQRAKLPLQVATFCDPDPAAADRLKALAAAGQIAPDIRLFTELDQAFAEQPHDVAILACPHDSHQELALRLADAGLAVWKEKPYALTLDQAVELDSRDVRVLAHRPHSQLLHLAADRLNAWGQLLSYRIRITRPTGDYSGTWRASASQAGGGAICDLGYHAFDLISRWSRLPNTRPAEVYAVTTASPSHRVSVPVEENAVLTITHTDGCAGTVHVSRCQERADEIDLIAEHGRLTITGNRALIQVPNSGRTHQVELNADDDPWVAMLSHHVNTLGNEKVTASEARTGVAATALMEAAYASVRLGRPTSVTTPDSHNTAPNLEGLPQ